MGYIIDKIHTAIALFMCSPSTADDSLHSTQKFGDWRFKDYLKKYDPYTVREGLEKQQKARGFNYSSVQYIDMMLEGMDGLDDLMKLKIQDVSPPEPSLRSTNPAVRRWQPDGKISGIKEDRFELRVRLYELMRQAIYQARNAMVVMQIYRKKHRNSKIYKMGFLMSKTDNAVKVFSQFAFRAFRLCGITRGEIAGTRLGLYDILLTEERLLNLWLNAQLLSELIVKNDEMAMEVIDRQGDLTDWNFENKKK